MAYTWKNAQIGGAGFISGLAIHPSTVDKVYVRTPTGGAYRYQATPDSLNRRWLPILDQFDVADAKFYGVESIEVSPHDVSGLTVLVALGRSVLDGNGRVYKSTDGGGTWTATELQVPMGGNDNYHWVGERLAWHRGNANTVYFGSRSNGLFRSTDAGVNWSNVNIPGNGTVGEGVLSVFAAASGHIFAAIQGIGLCRSTNGVDFVLLGGLGATDPRQIAYVNDSLIYVTFGTIVRKWTGAAWVVITPPISTTWNAIFVDPSDGNRVTLVESTNTPTPTIWVSTNGGTGWTSFTFLNGKLSQTRETGWLTQNQIGYVGAMRGDPNVSGRAWLAHWGGVCLTADFRASTINWQTRFQGLEPSSLMGVLPLLDAGGGAKVLTLHEHIGIVAHSDLDVMASASAPVGMTLAKAADFSEAVPSKIYVVGTNDYLDVGPALAAYSDNGGNNWTGQVLTWPNQNDVQPLDVAVSPGFFTDLISAPRGIGVGLRYSEERGVTWSESTGGPIDFGYSVLDFRKRVVFDRLNNSQAYTFKAGSFYRSLNGGMTWSVVNSSLPAASEEEFISLVASFLTTGKLWLGLGSSGLWTSGDGGSTWAQITNVTHCRVFGIGKDSLGSPILFLYGIVTSDSGWGIFRSVDTGVTWERINETGKLFGAEPIAIAGDRNVVGRVYLATRGRGLLVGEEGTGPSPPPGPSRPPMLSPVVIAMGGEWRYYQALSMPPVIPAAPSVPTLLPSDTAWLIAWPQLDTRRQIQAFIEDRPLFEEPPPPAPEIPMDSWYMPLTEPIRVKPLPPPPMYDEWDREPPPPPPPPMIECFTFEGTFTGEMTFEEPVEC